MKRIIKRGGSHDIITDRHVIVIQHKGNKNKQVSNIHGSFKAVHRGARRNLPSPTTASVPSTTGGGPSTAGMPSGAAMPTIAAAPMTAS